MSVETVSIPSFELANGVKIPALGLGTYPMDDENVQVAVGEAQQVGYRLFDTSRAYGNERGIGRVLARGSFVTTKVNNAAQREGKVMSSVLKSMVKLRRARVDLILLHWPYPGRFVESWRVLEGFYRRGLCRAIGVANFHEHHLRELMDAAKVQPMVNQVEMHPLLQQRELTEFCRSHSIQMEAYTPFGRMDERLVGDETLRGIARNHGKSVTQVILRWLFQRGVVAIPKTQTRDRMIENASIFDFELSDAEMQVIRDLDSGIRFRHNPDTCDFDSL